MPLNYLYFALHIVKRTFHCRLDAFSYLRRHINNVTIGILVYVPT